MSYLLHKYIELTKGDEKTTLTFVRPAGVFATNGNIAGLPGSSVILAHYTNGENVFSDRLGWEEANDFIKSQVQEYGYKWEGTI